MTKIQIRPVNEERDQDAIINLLINFFPAKNHWKKLFSYKLWKTKSDLMGFVICDGENIVGYIGIILNDFYLSNGEKHSICNVTSWFVLPDYRQHSLPLIRKVLALKKVTWTNLSASKAVCQFFLNYGFKPFATHKHIVLPLGGINSKIQIIMNNIEAYLDPTHQKIYLEHINTCSIHFILKKENLCCYCIAVKTQHKKIPLAKIYYVSHKNIFNNLLKESRLKLCIKLKVVYLIVESQYMESNYMIGMYTRQLNHPRLYKSDTLTPDDISLLYSELLVLGI